MRNIMDACPKRYHDTLKAKLRLMFNAPDIKTARGLLDDIVSEYAQTAPPEFDSVEAHAGAQKPRSLHFLVGGPRNRGFL
jgi:hypothetical protein